MGNIERVRSRFTLGALLILLVFTGLPSLNLNAKTFPENIRPWAEYETVGWIAMSSVNAFGSREAKIKIIEEMPPGVKALVYTQYNVDLEPAQLYFGRFVAEGRVEIGHLPIIGESTWTQDVFPIPVVPLNENGPFALVGSQNGVHYDPHEWVSDYFQVPLRTHDMLYEGGNFLASKTGDCTLINGIREAAQTDEYFKIHYGCQRMIRLPFFGLHDDDIGHVDERVKIVADGIVLTDTLAYTKIFETFGYKALLVPRPDRPYRNYLNSVMVNGHVFVPVFDNSLEDLEALQVYEQTGLFKKVIPVESAQFVDGGTGGLHCLSATFPPTKAGKAID